MTTEKKQVIGIMYRNEAGHCEYISDKYMTKGQKEALYLKLQIDIKKILEQREQRLYIESLEEG